MHFCSIDIGRIHCALVFWEANTIVHFQLCTMRDEVELDMCLRNCDSLWSTCSHVVIERQMRSNVAATKIEHQMSIWFRLVWPHLSIVLFESRNKYKNIDKTIYNTKYKRKQWAIEYAQTLLAPHLHDSFNGLHKRDDIADAIIIGHVFAHGSH